MTLQDIQRKYRVDLATAMRLKPDLEAAGGVRPETAQSEIRENIEKLSRPIDRLRALVLACQKIAPKMRADNKPNVAEMFDVAREMFQEGLELIAKADPVSPTRIAPSVNLVKGAEPMGIAPLRKQEASLREAAKYLKSDLNKPFAEADVVDVLKAQLPIKLAEALAVILSHAESREAETGEVAKLQHRMESAERAYDRLNLCPDHRDKTNGRCVVCVAEERTRQEATAIRALRGASQTEGE